MRVVYTLQSLDSLEEALRFSSDELGLSAHKADTLRNQLLDRADSLGLNPFKGQVEPYLAHLDQQHRRLVEGHYKIIYRVIDDTVYIVDFFDSRQDPNKMKA